MPVLKRPQLRIRFPDGTSTVVPLVAGLNTVGTSPAAHITLPGDRHAAKVHAVLTVENGRVTIREGRTRNGLWLKVGTEEIELRHGDQTLIGHTIATLEIHDEDVPEIP